MSRWGKSRTVPSYALPLDALLKEKENTNRPVAAARSAGTVGKWGVTSFTSMRARPVYGFASFSPNQDPSLQYSQFSPKSLIEGANTNTVQTPESNSSTVPKPKKFFKSRNSVPDANSIVAALSDSQMGASVMGSPSNVVSYYSSAPAHHHQQQQQQSAGHPYVEKAKRKKSTKSADTPKKAKAEKAPKVEKPPKPPKPEKPPKPPKVEKPPKASKKKPKVNEKVVETPKPTRVLSRTRKVVNYSEDQSRSPPRGAHTNNNAAALPPPPPPPTAAAATEPIAQPPYTNDLVTSSNHPAEIANNLYNPVEQNAQQMCSPSYHDDQYQAGDSPSKNSLGCGPPIKLRISKGTSRLISTDSEGISGSPPYLSPAQQSVPNSQLLQPSTNYSAAASLVAVLTDEPEPQQQSSSYVPNDVQIEPNTNAAGLKAKKEKAKPKAEPIKLKIKTNARLRNNTDLGQQSEEPETHRGRSTRRTTPQHTHVPNSIEDNVPVPGTPNYELYRTLTESPSNKQQYDQTQSHFAVTSDPSHNPISPEYQQHSYNYNSLQLNANIPIQQALEADAINSNTNSDTERGILPKKRRGRNKTKFETNAEAIPDEPIQKKQRGRRKNDEQPELIEAIPPSNDFANVQPPQPPIVDESIEHFPKKRITAAAKKQYKDENLFLAEQPNPSLTPVESTSQIEEVNTEPVGGNRRGRKAKPKANQNTANPEEMSQPEVPQRPTRATRHTANGNMTRDQVAEPTAAVPTRSYGRKRKIAAEDVSNPEPVQAIPQLSSDVASLTLPQSENHHDLNAISLRSPFEDSTPNETYDEQKKGRNRTKRQNQNQFNGSHEQQKTSNNNDIPSPFEVDKPKKVEENFEKPSVKLVISKKKGSIFKSRAIEGDSGESIKQKRHVYKHKWDDDSPEDKGSTHEAKTNPPGNTFESDFDMDDGPEPVGALSGSNSTTLSKFTRAARSNVPDQEDLRIRNVKKAHQMQEIGESQEMDDDVEYILESLKSQNPIATRSLAAIQLAFKCMTPAFRMHVRAHGTATRFFSALHDATQNQSLGLCTAAIMFVLIQDNLNMDLDKHSLELMLSLLDSDISRKNNYKETGLTDEQSQRNEQKVIEICREIKSQGKAEHLNLDNISIGTLAMETLLTLTSKRAGEWFKDEMRQLGGLEHIINTICECCKQISDYVIEWTETLLEKLRKIERCLRVLENVSERNEENQKYILQYKDGQVVETLVKFYKLCDSEISLYPTNDASPPGEPGVVLREALVPTLKVLINLTHTFNNKPLGSVLFGQKPIIFDTCLHLLFQAPQYIPEKCVFELSLLVLLLLINLVQHSAENRKIAMEVNAPLDSGNQYHKVPAIRAIIDYFYKYEEMARLVEQNTDDILNNPAEKCDKNKHKSQEDVEETVSKLLQKAGNHMEHTFLASYVCLLIGNLIMECKQHEMEVRKILRNQSFKDMYQILDKYHNFLNLTASSEAIYVNHMKETMRIIQFMKESDSNPSSSDVARVDERQHPTPPPTHPIHTASVSNTYSSTSSENRWASNSNTNTSSSSNSLFNKLYFSGR